VGLALAAAATACVPPNDGQPDGGTGIDGSVGGATLEAKDGMFARLTGEDQTERLVVGLIDKPGLCTRELATRNKAVSTVLILKIIKDVGVPGPGAYGVREPPAQGSAPPSWAEAIFQRYGPMQGSQCPLVQDQVATGGLVELTEGDPAEGKRAKGNFDVLFGGEDRLRGSFDVAFCDLSAATGEESCEP
jgi:hypothetical protein